MAGNQPGVETEEILEALGHTWVMMGVMEEDQKRMKSGPEVDKIELQRNDLRHISNLHMSKEAFSNGID